MERHEATKSMARRWLCPQGHLAGSLSGRAHAKQAEAKGELAKKRPFWLPSACGSCPPLSLPTFPPLPAIPSLPGCWREPGWGEAGAGVQPHSSAQLRGLLHPAGFNRNRFITWGFGCLPSQAQCLLPFPCLGNPCKPQPSLSRPRSPRPSTIPALAGAAKSWSASRKGRWLQGRQSRRTALILCINTSQFPKEAGEAALASPEAWEPQGSRAGSCTPGRGSTGQARSPQRGLGSSCPEPGIADLVCHSSQRAHTRHPLGFAAAADGKVGKAQMNRVLSVLSLQPSLGRARLQEGGSGGRGGL